MTVGIIPESDSKGRAVCQFWLQGGKHNVTPTDKITFRRESPWGPLDPSPPPFLGRKETTKFPKRKHSIKETLTRLGGEDREMPPHHGYCSLQAVSLRAGMSKVESSSLIL